MGPHQIAKLPDLLLRVELGAQVKEVEEGTQAETDHKVLSVVKRQDASGMFFGKAFV